MRALVFIAARDKVEIKSKFGCQRREVSNFKGKRHEGSGNGIVDYSRVPCLGADQKVRGLWTRDCM